MAVSGGAPRAPQAGSTPDPYDGDDEAPRTGAWARPRLHLSERVLLLVIVDGLLINLALFLALLIRPVPLWFYLGGYRLSQQTVRAILDQSSWFIILSIVWYVCAFMLDCYNLRRATSPLQSLGPLGGAIFLTSAFYLLIPRLTPALPTSRLDILIFPLLGVLVLGAWRAVYATVLVQPGFQQGALVIGAGSAGRTLVRAINQLGGGDGATPRSIGYQALGFIDDDPAKQGTIVEGVPVLGTRHDLVRLARRLRPSELVVAITHAETIDNALFGAILACHEMGLAITTMPTLYERLTSRVPVEHAGRALSVVLPLLRPVTHRFYLVFKRLLDIAVGLFGCLMLLAVMPFIWLGNCLTSPGPLFYSQVRVGKGGRTFLVPKFRSMTVDAEKQTGVVWAVENDPRITPIGRYLRKSRLDEFPQFWTILKGDMSLIGPRPERPYFVEQLATQIPFYRVRHTVKPGLTGWSQVMYRYGASVEDALTKLQYDLYYIKHQGILLELRILLKTVPTLIGLRGR